MMQALFERAGVDYVQWKAVSRTLLRSDFRPLGQSTGSRSLRTFGGFVAMALTYGIFGVGAAIIVVLNPDVLLTGVVTLSYVGVLLTTALLAQHGAAVASTTDYAILAPQPVSARTFLAIRLTNVLFHAALLTTFMAYPAVIAYVAAHGMNVARGVSAAVAIYAFACAVTCALVALYGTLLRVIGAERFRTVVSYAQMIVGMLAYGGIWLLVQVVGMDVVQSASMPRAPWLVLLPPAWFASYIEIAGGEAGWNAWARAALSVAALGSLLYALRGPLGMSYAERLGELSAATREREPARQAGRSLVFARGERRAVAILVRAHFRHDLRVRLGVLSIVPLTLLYMFLGIRDGAGDPFMGGGEGVDLVAIAVLFFPTLVVQQFSSSESYRAAWVYFATPASRPALVAALRNVIAIRFFLPYVIFLAALFTWRFNHVGHAAVHAAFLGLVGYLTLQLGMLVEPRLPFALPPRKAVNSTVMFVWMLTAMLGGTLLLTLIVDWVYRDWGRVAIAAVVLIACCALADWALRLRVRRRYEDFEFS
jgi:ABC-2 type transport system permease protein